MHRVSKRWYDILKSSRSWRVINFYDKGPVKENIPRSSFQRRFVSKHNKGHLEIREFDPPFDLHGKWRWQFPFSENDVFNFLSRHAGVALKEVYLAVISERIMNLLRSNCPNIRVLCSLFQHRSESSDLAEVEEILYFPPTLERLILQAPRKTKYTMLSKTGLRKKLKATNTHQRDEKIFLSVSQCRELQKLTLSGFILTSAGMQRLIGHTSLTEINLWGCDRKSVTSESTDHILATSIGVLQNIQCLRLYCLYLSTRLHELLKCIGQWQHLNVLVLKDYSFSEEAFESMIPGLQNLELLQLEGRSVTSNIVSKIGDHLKKITVLKLRGDFTSPKSFESFLYHPTLKSLSVSDMLPQINYSYHHNNTMSVDRSRKYFRAIYNVLATLSEIKYVQLKGHRFTGVFMTEQFPEIETADIEIQDNPSNGDVFDESETLLEIMM